VRPRWLALGIAVAVVATFAPVAQQEFLDYDDPRYVTQNPNLASGLSPGGIWQDFREPYFGNWIPLTHLSLRIDHALYGDSAPGYLVTNVALHLTAALLLFAALLRTTGAAGRSAFVAIVFALHPLRVESVAWVSERKDVLSGALLALTLWLYARAAERPASAFRRLAVLAAAAAGLLAKPMLVTLPVLLLLLDVWPLGRIRLGRGARVLLPEGARVLVEKLPLAALSGIVSWITLRVQDSAGALFPIEHLSFGARAVNALRSLAVYAGESFWPVGLAAFHPLPLEGFPRWQISLAALFVAVATALAIGQRRTRPYLAIGWFWYVVALLPVIGLVQVGMQAHADRYTYVPQIGIAIAVAFGGHELATRWRLSQRAQLAIGVAIAGLLAVATHQQLRFWKNSLALHERVVAIHPESFRNQSHLAEAYLRAGRLEDAQRHFELAAQRAPRWAPAWLGQADLAMKRGDVARAIALYERGLALDSKHTRALGNYGTALVRVGRYSEARGAFERAIALQDAAPSWEPRSAEPHLGLGDALWALGDPGGARASYERGIALAPDHAAGHTGLAVLLLELGDGALASRHLARGVELGDDSAKSHLGRGMLADARGETDPAIAAYRAALARDAGLVTAQNNLAWLLATHPDRERRRAGEAVALAEQAVSATQRSAPAMLDTLAVALAAAGRFDEAERALGEAVEQARAAGNAALLAEIERHLERVRGREAPTP
jgi:Tfp pilus assembly protein PilF